MQHVVPDLSQGTYQKVEKYSSGYYFWKSINVRAVRNSSIIFWWRLRLYYHRKKKNRGQDGKVALKLDTSKAYDRVKWSYLKCRMKIMGFFEKWIRWVMHYVSTLNYIVVFNGSNVGAITPKQGLRQGDPLSPYLFLFHVKGPSYILTKAADEGALTRVKSVLMPSCHSSSR